VVKFYNDGVVQASTDKFLVFFSLKFAELKSTNYFLILKVQLRLPPPLILFCFRTYSVRQQPVRNHYVRNASTE